jgi:hypothetical protein
MTNEGRRLRRWRSRLCKVRGATRHSAGPGTACGQTARGGTAADEIVTGEIVASEPPASAVAAGETVAGETVAAAMQLAIGLLTASLDSPELEARALATLMPHDADGLGDFMAGLHVVSELLIHELHEATGEPPEAILQRLAIMAEHRRGTPSAG